MWLKCYGQQRSTVNMASLVYAGSMDETIYTGLSEHIPSCQMPSGITETGQAEKSCRIVWPAEHEGTDRPDEKPAVWAKRVERRDIEARLMNPWDGRKNKVDR